MSKYLSRDQILAADDIETRDVPVPEWGGTVRVRGLTGKQRSDFLAATVQRRGNQVAQDLTNMQAKLAAMAIVNEAGEPLFTRQDVAALGEKSGQALERVFTTAAELSGLADEAIEAMSGNSEAAPSGGSTSD